MLLATKRAVNSEYGQYPYSPNKVKVRRVKRSTSPFVGVLIIAVIFILGLSFTFMKAGTTYLIWQLNQTKEMNVAIHMDNEKLRLEASKLKSLDRIEQIAANEIGMVKNPSIEYLAFNEKLNSIPNNSAAPLADQGKNDNGIAALNAQENGLLKVIASAFKRGNMAKG